MTNTTVHIFPNTNKGLIIEQDERLWSHLGDYSDFDDNALSVNKSHRQLRNMNTDCFGNNAGLMGSLMEELETNIGAYTEPMARNARQAWNMAVTMVSSTHGDLQPVDFDKIAWTIWQARWKPLYESHIEWVEQRLRDCDYDALKDDYFDDISRHITYSAFDLFDGLEVNIDNALEEIQDEGGVEKLTKTWINHLKNQVSTEEQNFTVDTLDMFMEFFHEMDISSNNFSLWSRDGDGQLNIIDTMRETAVDLYINYNPNVFLADITEGRDNYMITAFDSSEIKHSADDVEDANALIIASSKEQAEGIEQGINQFLNGDWYWGKAIQFIPKEEWTKYEASDLEKDPEHGFYIDLDESCGGFESEEAVIEHFNYLGQVDD